MRRATLAFLLAAVAMPSAAGTIIQRSDGDRITIEGDSYRVDLPAADAPRTYDAVVSRDHDRTAFYINDANRTWFERTPDQAVSTSLRFGYSLQAKIAGSPRVESSTEPTDEVIASHPTEKHVVRVAYRLESEFQRTRVRSGVGATIIVWTARDLPPAPIGNTIRTGFADVDDKLNAIFAALGGLILQETTSITQEYEGGRPFTDVRSWTTKSIEPKVTTPALFEVPPGFVHQFPQVAAPGK